MSEGGGPFKSSDRDATPEKSRRVHVKVTRTRMACLTCKARKKRCDLVRPRCAACTRLSLYCEWPSIRHLNGRSTETSSPYPESHISRPPVNEASGPLAGPGSTIHRDSATPAGAFRTYSFDPQADDAGIGTAHRTPMAGQLAENVDIGSRNQALPGSQAFPPQSNPIDDAVLQLWLETCAPFLTAPVQTRSPKIHPPLRLPPLSARSTLQPVDPTSGLPDGEIQTEILDYFRDQLTSLVSYDDVMFPDAFQVFSMTASANIESQAGRALHCGILALAARHMVNKGQSSMERVSEQLGDEGSDIIMTRLRELEHDGEPKESELITLLAGLLMFLMYKICRGDVWGFGKYIAHLGRLCSVLFPLELARPSLSSPKFSLLEEVVYHDSCSSSIYLQGSVLPSETSIAYANLQRGTPHPLTGLALPLYCVVPLIGRLVKTRWTQQDMPWSDRELDELTSSVQEVEDKIEAERLWLEDLVIRLPDMTSHRYFHDAYRIACILQLKCFVLDHPPQTLTVQHLVRKALSLLETMEMLSLPGFVSSHWILFTVAVCSAGPSVEQKGQSSDRERIVKLYDLAISHS
ncbi:fungal-specific transcription factor domain-domain-containing protein [Kockovaella imperatae]|uniref:Fungal-specific transcription factor domain-domain-containing protein n=1 Tax=Kockovaella imperatae TaxID=4999 RepID=A0A1Y1UM21_9TREE|nr:fungal-specific transcription factor domain-domain-containing protein [Kockovaella imperatae]ORX39100.1 fungal-specific transcription factor domain-domain-containing protein [Kockovaella imperatae]